MISMMENFKTNIFLWLNNPAWPWESSPHPRRLHTEDCLHSVPPSPALPSAFSRTNCQEDGRKNPNPEEKAGLGGEEGGAAGK